MVPPYERLIGLRVSVLVIDPFLPEEQPQFEGAIVAIDQHAALVLSHEEISINAVSSRRLVASPRHEGRRLSSMLAGENVGCSGTLVPEERFNAASPLDVSWWRGGGALLVELALADRQDKDL